MTVVANRFRTLGVLLMAERAANIAEMRIVRIDFHYGTTGITIRVVVSIRNNFSLVLTMTLDAGLLVCVGARRGGSVTSRTFHTLMLERH